MRLAQFKLLTDENIHREVVELLWQRGFDVLDVAEEGLFGATDVDLLRRAVSENRVVVTHDRDFGTLALLGGEPIVGIVYLRPGHIAPSFTIEMIDAVASTLHDLSPPFIVVVQRKDSHVTMRVRRLWARFIHDWWLARPSVGPTIVVCGRHGRNKCGITWSALIEQITRQVTGDSWRFLEGNSVTADARNYFLDR